MRKHLTSCERQKDCAILTAMKKVSFFFACLVMVFALSGCSLRKPPSALQINTTPSANVFIDGKLLGKTPYQASDLKAGEILVKLIPESTTQAMVSWEGKVRLNPGVLTLVEQDFAATEAGNSGQVLTLEKIKDNKNASLTVISDPDGIVVNLDGEAKGFTPITIDKVGVGDHQITLTKSGFLEKTVRAKAVVGYKLIATIKLSQESTATVTPSASGSVTPGPSGSPAKPYVEIKETPTGWLRVRMEPNTNATEAARVKPGEKYALLDEQTGWYKIRFETKEGWVSADYATKYQ